MTKLTLKLKDGSTISRLGEKIAAMCGGKNYYFTVDGSVFSIPKKEIKSMCIEN